MINRNKVLISFMLITSTFSGLVIPAYAADNNIPSTIVSTANEQQNDTTNDIIVNSDTKPLKSLDKVPKYLGFDYKVPDYLPDYPTISGITISNYYGNSNTLTIDFENKKENYATIYSIYAFKNDPVDELNKVSLGEEAPATNPDITKKSKTINGINGFDITVPVYETYFDSKNYFVWQNDGIWYAVSYTYFDNVISDEDIGKIAASLKPASQIKNVDYSINNSDPNYDYVDSMNVYDKEDLKNCVDILGYSPKMPLKIDSNVKIEDCSTTKKNAADGSSYRTLDCLYSYNDDSVIYFSQVKDKDTFNYEKAKESGYAMTINNEKVDTKTENIGGIDVIKYIDSSYKRAIYLWEDNGTYYYLSYYYDKTPTWIDSIVKEFIKSDDINL